MIYMRACSVVIVRSVTQILPVADADKPLGNGAIIDPNKRSLNNPSELLTRLTTSFNLPAGLGDPKKAGQAIYPCAVNR